MNEADNLNSTNGGFENNFNNPFTSTLNAPNPLGKRLVLHSNTIVSSSAAPAPYPGLCNYILQITYPGGSNLQEDTFAYILPFTVPGQIYSISFDTLACGATDSTWAVQADNFIIASGSNAACGPGAAGWNTYRGSFTATGVLDTIYIRVTGFTGLSSNYFDNFVILRTSGVSSPSSTVRFNPFTPAPVNGGG